MPDDRVTKTRGGGSLRALALAACAGAVLGIGTLWLLGVGAEPSPPAVSVEAPQRAKPAGIDPDEEIRALRQRVASLESERTQLEGELALLRASLLAEPERVPTPGSATSDIAATPAAPGAERPKKAPGRRRLNVNEQPQKPFFDSDALERSGLSASEAQRVRDRWEQFQLDKLYLTDEAKRQGYLKKARYRRELAELQAELRDDLGDFDYDAFLYATEQPNRVVVGEVLEDSPAEDAGFLAGDSVLAYAGERVFRPRELRDSTTQGEEGETVEVDIERDGRVFTLRVSRGPLGVMIRMQSAPPRDL